MFDAKSYPITIAETAHFQRTVKKILTEEELSELIGHVAFNPTGGDLMPGTGAFGNCVGGFRGTVRGREPGSFISSMI